MGQYTVTPYVATTSLSHNILGQAWDKRGTAGQIRKRKFLIRILKVKTSRQRLSSAACS